MLISTKGRYALRVMIEFARYNREEYVPLKEIAAQQEISEKYLEAIVKKLVNSQLVHGVRGKGGGYRLARNPEEYTVREILEVTEGSLAPIACKELSGGYCSRSNQSSTLPMWRDLDQMIYNFFENITLEQMVKQSEQYKANEI